MHRHEDVFRTTFIHLTAKLFELLVSNKFFVKATTLTKLMILCA